MKRILFSSSVLVLALFSLLTYHTQVTSASNAKSITLSKALVAKLIREGQKARELATETIKKLDKKIKKLEDNNKELTKTFDKRLRSLAKKQSPIGTIVPFVGTKVPSGWLLCDGRALKNDGIFKNLYNTIGTAHGNGRYSSDNRPIVGYHFNIPDYRGRFLRGTALGNSRKRDPDSTKRLPMAPGGNSGGQIGSIQADAFQGHKVKIQSYGNNQGRGSGFNSLGQRGGATSVYLSTGIVSDGRSGTPRIASETRPINAYVNFIIKY